MPDMLTNMRRMAIGDGLWWVGRMAGLSTMHDSVPISDKTPGCSGPCCMSGVKEGGRWSGSMMAGLHIVAPFSLSLFCADGLKMGAGSRRAVAGTSCLATYSLLAVASWAPGGKA